MFGRHNNVLPIIPDWITSSTWYFPPKSHLDAGHITGSHTLNNILQSLGSMKSWHCTAGIFGADFTSVYVFPSIITGLFPYWFAASVNALTAFPTSSLAFPSSIPGNAPSGCPVSRFISWHMSSPKPDSWNCSLPFTPTLQSQKLLTLPEDSNPAIPPKAGSVCFVPAYHPSFASIGTSAGSPL